MKGRSERTENTGFNETQTLQDLCHHLPSQAPLKDFVHHNSLHAFQDMPFEQALNQVSGIFGYQAYLPIAEFRKRYHAGEINPEILQQILREKFPGESHSWSRKLLEENVSGRPEPRIGQLRRYWKRCSHVDMEAAVHPVLFRFLCNYLDQGIAIWTCPEKKGSFLDNIRSLDKGAYRGFFQGSRAAQLLHDDALSLKGLLQILVGDERYFRRYLFDQQFSHPGWSGMVAVLEHQPEKLLDSRHITLRDVILFELLLEIDALDAHHGTEWKPLAVAYPVSMDEQDILADVDENETMQVCALFQQALEWSLYDPVLRALQLQSGESEAAAIAGAKTFQALFCIDDRCGSLRRHVEQLDHACETFGTPGFFGVDSFFQPEHSQHHSKICPPPVQPGFIVRERDRQDQRQADFHHSHHATNLFGGMLITHTLGLLSAFKLFFSIFRPAVSPASTFSFSHMHADSELSVENSGTDDREDNLQIGYQIDEMAERAERLLQSIGLTREFAEIVYLVGHGASSVNNPYYAAYDCGACSGRPGSVNARVMCQMLNHGSVRQKLAEKGILIPETTRFIGGLHDTTRDEIQFYDSKQLDEEKRQQHHRHQAIFSQALKRNARERSRRFELTPRRQFLDDLHQAVKKRSVSLFETRPELNHATNAFCIIGRRRLTQKLFLDRRAFLNSFDYRNDPQGDQLLNILRAAAPVCGGINLEYYFSRVDNQKLGAGSKLPHNVMGLIGVANGAEGDLRTGLPTQMIELHDPLRMLIVVEHFPEVVLAIIRSEAALWQWFSNEWLNLAVIDPRTHQLSRFDGSEFIPYEPVIRDVPDSAELESWLDTHMGNISIRTLN